MIELISREQYYKYYNVPPESRKYVKYKLQNQDDKDEFYVSYHYVPSLDIPFVYIGYSSTVLIPSELSEKLIVSGILNEIDINEFNLDSWHLEKIDSKTFPICNKNSALRDLNQIEYPNPDIIGRYRITNKWGEEFIIGVTEYQDNVYNDIILYYISFKEMDYSFGLSTREINYYKNLFTTILLKCLKKKQ